MQVNPKNGKTVLGWREWVGLSDLGIDKIKAKIDTGARTSTLHAFDLEIIENKNKRMARFKIHPLQRNSKLFVECLADIIDERDVTDSGGHLERRLVIKTMLKIGNEHFPIEMTLTNRDNMRFRMLLGRTALKPHFIVDPARSFLTRTE